MVAIYRPPLWNQPHKFIYQYISQFQVQKCKMWIQKNVLVSHIVLIAIIYIYVCVFFFFSWGVHMPIKVACVSNNYYSTLLHLLMGQLSLYAHPIARTARELQCLRRPKCLTESCGTSIQRSLRGVSSCPKHWGCECYQVRACTRGSCLWAGEADQYKQRASVPPPAEVVAPTSRQAELGLDGGRRKLSAGAEQLKRERVDPKHKMQCRHLLLVAWSRAQCVPVSVLRHRSLLLTQRRHHMERGPAKHREQGSGEKWAGSSPGSAHLHRLRLSALLLHWRASSCLLKLFSSLL